MLRTDTACTDSLETPHGLAAKPGCSCTSTLAQEPRTQPARNSWRRVLPWDTDGDERIILFPKLAELSRRSR